jgi:methyl-accepting chemotaxis protein
MNLIHRIKIKSQLLGAFFLMILFMGAIGLTGIVSLTKLNRNLETLNNSRLPANSLILEIEKITQGILVNERSMIFTNVSSETYTELTDTYDDLVIDAEDKWEKYKSLPKTEDEKALLDTFQAKFNDWKIISQKVVDARNEDTSSGRRLAIDLTVGQAKEKFTAMTNELNKLSSLNAKYVREGRSHAQSIYSSVRVILFAIIGVGILMATFLSVLIGFGISTPIKRITNAAIGLSKGQFSKVNLKHRNEIGDLASALNGTQTLIDDVNRQKKQSLELVDNLQKLPFPVIKFDKQMNITFVNDEVANFLKKDAEDILGKKCHDMFNGTLCKSNTCPGRLSISGGEHTHDDGVAHVNGKGIPGSFNGIPVYNTDGEVIGGLEVFADLTDTYKVAHKVKETIHTLKNVTETLVDTSKIMTDNSGELSTLSELVSKATQAVNSTVSEVSSASQDALGKVENMSSGTSTISEGVNTVASAIEELNITFNEVSKNTIKASDMASDVSTQSQEVNRVMNDLTVSAQRIGKVIKIISEIADQTNMLALNAAIEAASAGEAGKGFAVVASEVKDLAKQTADSTKEITLSIENIQKETDDATKRIVQIMGIITELNQQNQSISSSVEEQSATANEISKTVTENSKFSRQVAQNATETNKIVETISRSMNNTTKSVGDISQNIEKISSSGEDLKGKTNDVNIQIDSLKKEVSNLGTLIESFKLIDEINL